MLEMILFSSGFRGRGRNVGSWCAPLVVLLAAAVLPPALQARQDPLFEVHPDYTVRQWTTREGLPLPRIKQLLQTRDGYLWLTTDEGLVRFDGNAFTVFNSTNTPALAGNRLSDLTEGPPGHLWITDVLGNVVHHHHGRFDLVDDTLPSTNRVFYLGGDSLWISRPNGLVRYTGGALEPVLQEEIGDRVRAVARDREGRLWLLSGGELVRRDPDGTTRRFAVTPAPAEAPIYFPQILPAPEGGVWLSSNGRLLRTVGERLDEVEALAGERTSLHYIDAEGRLWFAGLRDGEPYWGRLDTLGAVTTPYASAAVLNIGRMQVGPDGRQWRAQQERSPDGASSLLRIYRGDELVFSLQSAPPPEQDRFLNFQFDFYFDPAGRLWVTSAAHGLFLLRPAQVRMLGREAGLPLTNVYPILEDRSGSVWVGTLGGGLVRLESVAAGTDEVLRAYSASAVSTGGMRNILSLYQDRRGTIWVGGLGPVCRVEGLRCREVSFTLEGDDEGGAAAYRARGVRAILEDREGRFWIGAQNGLLLGQPDADTLRWRRVPTTLDLNSTFVRAIHQTRDGAVFFGTRGAGLLRYLDEDAGEADPFEILSTDTGLPSNQVRDLYEDHEAYLWIALEDRGLCRLDRRRGQALRAAELACIDSRGGLYGDGLHRILEDDQGRFWFNTNQGIFWVERWALMAWFDGELAAVSSVSYTEADGLRNREGNGGMQPAGMRSRDGRLWFPTQAGVAVVDPSSVPYPSPPPVRVEGVWVEEAPRGAAEAVSLESGERDVEIRYTAMAFSRPEDVRFQYRLAGYDADWRDVGSLRQATYTNLPSGRYEFEVRAGLGGRWGAPASVVIERAQYWWLSWWALLFFGLVVVALGYGGYRYRLRQMEARTRALEAVVDERTEELRRANALKSRFLANISHEFRTPLTLTFGPIDDLLDGRFTSFDQARPHFERARRNGGRLLRLINQLLDLSKLDAGSLLLHLREHDLGAHLRQVASLFDSVALTHAISFRTALPAGSLRHVYDEDRIDKVVVNLLSNAFKFTPSGGKVSLALERLADGSVQIAVSDTGVGIAAEHLPHVFERFYQVESEPTRGYEGTGIGLSLVEEMVRLHGGSVTVESREGMGSCFTVVLPPQEADPHDGEQEEELLPEAERAEVSLERTSGDAAPEPPPEAALPEEETAPAEAPVVLVVEDNPDMRAYLRAHLEDTYTVAEADNGRRGLEAACELVPDLIVSDVMMPELDGLALCRALKEDERTSHIPVVLLTARSQVEHRIEGYESGAEAYLGKPFNATELRVRVRTLIAERRRLRARYRGADGRPVDEPGAAGEAGAEAPALPAREAAFLAKVEAEIARRLSDAQFGVEDLAEAVLMSRRQLFRKLGALTEETPAAMIRRLRLERAAELLRSGDLSVQQVCAAVGYQSDSSFARAFARHHGVAPADYTG